MEFCLAVEYRQAERAALLRCCTAVQKGCVLSVCSLLTCVDRYRVLRLGLPP